MLLGLLVVLVAQSVGAQHRSKLDDPVRTEFRILNLRLLQPCEVGTAVDQIARNASVRVGFENAADCGLSSRSLNAGDDAEVLTGLSARQALDRLVASVPDFSWREMDGVVVVRPKAAWSDLKNTLNLPTTRFARKDVQLHEILHAMLDAVTPPLSRPHLDFPVSPRSSGPPVSIAFRGGTLLDALNAIVRARRDAQWQLGYTSNWATIWVNTLALSEESVMVPLVLH
jgi:hypothetical protein